MDNIHVLPQHKISRSIQVIGFVFFAVLTYISWHFYLERMVCFDNALFVFRMLHDGSLIESNARYGDYLPELLPYLAYKMGCSLHIILIFYSISFILLHYLIFLFTTLILKNNGAGIAIMLASCLAYHYSFYLPTELHEGLVLGVLLWAIIHPEYPYITPKQKNSAITGAIVTIIVMYFFHPLCIFLVAFVIGIEMIQARRLNDKRLWIIALFGIGWYIVKFYFIFKQSYDQDQLISVHDMISHISNWEKWASTRYIGNLIKWHFRSFFLITAICILLSLRKGVLTFLFFIIYITLFSFVFLANYQAGASDVVFENYYIIYGFFTALIFVSVLYHPERKTLALLFTIPLLWMGVSKIYHAHDLFTYRVAYLQRIINAAHKKGEKKCIIDYKCYPYDYAWGPWNVAFETLIYSSIPGPDSTVSIFIKTPEFDRMCANQSTRRNILFGPHFSPNWFLSNDMPEKYIKLPSTGYSYLTHSQDDTSFHENNFSAENIKFAPLPQMLIVKVTDRVAVIPLVIVNRSGKTIPAIPADKNPVYLSCSLYNDKDSLLQKAIKEPLETDIGERSVVGLIVKYPREKKTYYIKPDIITEGKRHWNIPASRIKIIVD